MSQPQAAIASMEDAEHAIVALHAVMDELEQTLSGRNRTPARRPAARCARARAHQGRPRRPLHRRKRARARGPAPDRRRAAGRARHTAPAARRVPGPVAEELDGAGDRPCGVGRHHPRRFRRAHPPARALDLRRLRPRQRPKPESEPAAGHQPHAVAPRAAASATRAPPRKRRPPPHAVVEIVSPVTVSTWVPSGMVRILFWVSR